MSCDLTIFLNFFLRLSLIGGGGGGLNVSTFFKLVNFLGFFSHNKYNQISKITGMFKGLVN